MSPSNSFSVVEENAEEQTSKKSEAASEEHFDFKKWLQTSLKEKIALEKDGDDQSPSTDEVEQKLDIVKQKLSTRDGFLEVLSDVSEEFGKKRLFVCCDGTWLNASGTVAPLSNVAKLARSVQRVGLDDPSFATIGGVPQLVYYSSGVGTQSTLQMDSNVAAVTGKGISHVIRDAYCFISNNYNGSACEDEIILVGFSRGAFTVRCLAEFISRVGLLRRRALPLLPVFFEDWVTGNDELLEKRLEDMHELFLPKSPIKILAEWDPVDTLGIPHLYESGLERCMEAQTVPAKVEHAFLALSLGEKRLSYWPTVWKKNLKKLPGTNTDVTVSQCAFLGDHGDVGGGHPDPGLSTISLLWMVSKIRHACRADFQVGALLQFNTPLWRPDSPFRLGPFGRRYIHVRNLANTKGIVHQPSFWWFLPNYLTFGRLFSGRRGAILHELAANQSALKEPVTHNATAGSDAAAERDGTTENATRPNTPNEVPETTRCNLEVHRTVRLLQEERKLSPSPLDKVEKLLDHRYQWTVEGHPESPIYEQQLGNWEKTLLKNWKMEAKIWEEGSKFVRPQGYDDQHSWPEEWEGLNQNEIWGFERGKFNESLIKLVCDGLGDELGDELNL